MVTKHIHTFYKERQKSDLWKCADPYCTFFTRNLEQILGKVSLCNLCREEFLLTKEDSKRARPRCASCSNTPKGHITRQAKELISKVLVEDKEGLDE